MSICGYITVLVKTSYSWLGSVQRSLAHNQYFIWLRKVEGYFFLTFKFEGARNIYLFGVLNKVFRILLIILNGQWSLPHTNYIFWLSRYKEIQQPLSLKLGFDDDIDSVSVLCYINIPNFDLANKRFIHSTNFQSSSWFGSKARPNMSPVSSKQGPDMVSLIPSWIDHGPNKVYKHKTINIQMP